LVPKSQLLHFDVRDETGQRVSTKKPKQVKQTSNQPIININVTFNNNINVFNIIGNTEPIFDDYHNRYTATDSGAMNNDELIKFIETIIVEHTKDKPAALILDALGYQHNDRTKQICNKHNITLYKVPPNTTGWLQPCDVTLFGPTKQKVRSVQKSDRQKNISPTLHRTCHQFSEALNSVSTDVIKRTFDRLRTATPTELRHKSASNSIQRSQTTFTGHSNSQP